MAILFNFHKTLEKLKEDKTFSKLKEDRRAVYFHLFNTLNEKLKKILKLFTIIF
jgi:hypothetical protein